MFEKLRSNSGGSAPRVGATGGRISRMVGREIERIGSKYDTFRDAWVRQDLARAEVAFANFRSALERHMRWEEESLFEEFEKRCSVSELHRVRAHHVRHDDLEKLVTRIASLLGRRMGVQDDVEEELGAALFDLDGRLREHRAIELDDVCLPLDAALDDPTVNEIETELYERGRS